MAGLPIYELPGGSNPLNACEGFACEGFSAGSRKTLSIQYKLTLTSGRGRNLRFFMNQIHLHTSILIFQTNNFQTRIPARWLAIESLTSQVYVAKSDV